MRPLLQLFLSFAKVGSLGWGGGPSMIPLMQVEVERHGWMTPLEFADALALGNALPGPIATKVSTLVGYKIAGLPGAAFATLGLLVPSTLLIVGLYISLSMFKDSTAVASVLRGVRPAVVALLVFVAFQVSTVSLISLPTLGIAIGCLVAVMMWNVHPAWLILASGLIGWLLL